MEMRIASFVYGCFLSVACLLGVERPDHIVVIIADDHSARDSTPYGSDLVDTPNMQKFSEEGMTFDRAYVASPSCGPSRGALLTGLMPSRNGAMRNHTFPKAGVPYLTQTLSETGYLVAAFGKVSHGGMKGAGRAGFGFVDTTFLADADFRKREVNEAYTGESLEAVRRYMEENGDDQSLCLFLGISDPHKPWTSTRGRYGPSEKNFDAPHFVDSPVFREEMAHYYNEIDHVDHLLGEFRSMAKELLGENVLYVYTADHGAPLPFAKWTLFETGIRSPMIVSWEGHISRGVRSEAMVSWVDLLPTLIEVGGGVVPGNIDGRSFLPILKEETKTHRELIFASHVGDGDKNYSPSRSVSDGRWKYVRYLDDEYMFTTHQDLSNEKSFAPFYPEWNEVAATGNVRAREILRRYYLPAQEHLYDLEADPFEEKNLAGKAKYAKAQKRLEDSLESWMREQGDDGIDEGKSRYKRSDALFPWGGHE